MEVGDPAARHARRVLDRQFARAERERDRIALRLHALRQIGLVENGGDVVQMAMLIAITTMTAALPRYMLNRRSVARSATWRC